jgi:hypothetical protein
MIDETAMPIPEKGCDGLKIIAVLGMTEHYANRGLRTFTAVIVKSPGRRTTARELREGNP